MHFRTRMSALPALALLAGSTLLAGCWSDAIGPADGPLRFTVVAAGDEHTCAISTAGATWCWGREAQARLGFASDAQPCAGDACVEPVRTLGGQGLETLSAGASHNCARADRVAYCWGWGRWGQIGNEGQAYDHCDPIGVGLPQPCSIEPAPVSLGFPVVEVTAAADQGCAVVADGTAWCWGQNHLGQLGNGGTSPTSRPTAVSGGLSFTSISAGSSHTCGLTDDGAAWCWGSNDAGRLGDGGTADSRVPVPVIGGMRWRQIDAGDTHTCGIAEDGLAYCWGTARGGRLGNGADTAAVGPVLVRLSVGPVRDISAGDSHSCAIAGAAHEVHCWGYGFAGQLGNNRGSQRPFPDRAQADGPFVDVSAGKLHTCAVHEDGRMFCWGSNEYGQLGTGDRVNRPVPAPVAQ